MPLRELGHSLADSRSYGIRTRVYGPPRASCSESRASGMLTQLRGPGDLNSEGGSSSSTYTRDLEEKHKILINRRTSRRGNRSAPVRSARISPRASGAPPSAIPAGSGQDGPAFG